MITVICTTNRPDSNTRKVAEIYAQKLDDMGEENQLLDLRTVDANWIQDSNYGENTPEFEMVVSKYIREVDRLVFIVPEYNGGFPGYVKFFMDACAEGDFGGKKVALMGLASGRSGNVRGLDHLTGILHYLGSEVYSRKVYFSQVYHSLNTSGELENEIFDKEVEAQLTGFITF